MNYGLANKPKSGATLRVWEIADSASSEFGRTARRREVIERYVAEGGNPNTAATQYQYWKMAREGEPPVGRATLALGGTAPDADKVLRFAVAPDGALRLPPEVMSGLGIGGGGTLSGRIENGQLTLVEPLVALRRVQEALRPLAARFRAEGRSIVDELIAERRAEAGSEGTA